MDPRLSGLHSPVDPGGRVLRGQHVLHTCRQPSCARSDVVRRVCLLGDATADGALTANLHRAPSPTKEGWGGCGCVLAIAMPSISSNTLRRRHKSFEAGFEVNPAGKALPSATTAEVMATTYPVLAPPRHRRPAGSESDLPPTWSGESVTTCRWWRWESLDHVCNSRAYRKGFPVPNLVRFSRRESVVRCSTPTFLTTHHSSRMCPGPGTSRGRGR